MQDHSTVATFADTERLTINANIFHANDNIRTAEVIAFPAPQGERDWHVTPILTKLKHLLRMGIELMDPLFGAKSNSFSR